MPLLVNIRHLQDKDVVLEGTLPTEELDISGIDELIKPTSTLKYDIEAELMEHAILVQGVLELVLNCECVRCLKPFQHTIRLDHWACHLALTGEEKAAVINDCVDLTPYIREDILLSFPQHPLCEADCSGLSNTPLKDKKTSGASQTEEVSSAWAELNKLKLER